MGQNPLNLALRFFLELVILVALGYWAWTRETGILRYVLSLGLPVVAALLWGTFRVPGEVAGNPHAPVPVPGWLRLVMELVLFAAATWAFYDAGARMVAAMFGVLWVFHYVISYDRIAWMLRVGSE